MSNPTPRLMVSMSYDRKPTEKVLTAEQIEEHKKEFLARGGKIEKVPTGAHGVDLARPRNRRVQLNLRGSRPD